MVADTLFRFYTLLQLTQPDKSTTMKVKIFIPVPAPIFSLFTDQSDDDELNRDIEPTDLELLPEERKFLLR